MTLRWFRHVMRISEDCFAKRVYESSNEGGGVRGRPPMKWIDKEDEYWRERSSRLGIEDARRE